MEVLKTAQIVVASTVTIYWVCVVVMVIRSRRKYRVASGSIPKTRLERAMWLLWVPTIIAWIILAWNSDNLLYGRLQNAFFESSWFALVAIASICCVIAFALTTRCWMKMGKDWSMAVEPGKETKLITDGPFSSVRHPIYALSLMLMISTVLVVTSIPMMFVAALHCGLLVMKSWNEERYLTRLHGQQYVDYLNRTNRFVPVRAIWRMCFG